MRSNWTQNYLLPSNSTSVYTYPKEMKTRAQMGILTPIFTAGLFTRAKRWKQAKCLLVNERTNKIYRVYLYVCV